MGDHLVVRTDKETEWRGGQHRHVAALCPQNEAKVFKAVAIANIESGRERYHTVAEGQRATVEVVQRCGQCASRYLRTDRDTTAKNNLLNLPDCS